MSSAETVIRFGEANRGRVTGWAVACTVHGAMPLLAPGRDRAIVAAGRHRDAEHSGNARIVEVRKGKVRARA